MQDSANSRKSWLLRPDHRDIVPESSAAFKYHRALAGDKRRIGRGIGVIILLLIGFILFTQVILVGATEIDTRVLGRSGFTPLRHAAGAFALALLIPYSMLLQRVFYGLPARSLHSVAGCFRFGVFGRSLIAFGPLVLIFMSIASFLMPGDTIAWSAADLIAFFVIGMILTPLAAAGEEYGVRGLMFRIVSSWTRGPLSGAVLGIVLTTVLFSLAHGSLDPYILSSYLVLFSTLAIVTWRTGGLEVAIVLHGVYNVTALVLATTLHTDMGGALSSRGEASGTMAHLLPGVGLIAIAAFILWTTRSGLTQTSGAASRSASVDLTL